MESESLTILHMDDMYGRSITFCDGLLQFIGVQDLAEYLLRYPLFIYTRDIGTLVKWSMCMRVVMKVIS